MRYTLTTPSTLWNVLHPVAIAVIWLALPPALLPALWPTDAAAAICPETDDVQLTAGQSNNAGDVKVCNDGDTLTITYEATYPFCLLETDLHVATIPEPPAEPDDNIPQNMQGNPTPDEFSYFGLPDDGCAGTATYEIPLDEIDGDVSPDDPVVIAARADLEDEDGRVEEAWGDGTRFVERGNWATYFTYVVNEPSCDQEGDSCTVFVTSTLHDGNLGGLAGADQICQNLADSADSEAAPGTYKAWLSASGAGNSAEDRLTQAAVSYRLVNGTLVANGFVDLTTCDAATCLLHPINRTEKDGLIQDVLVWTGTQHSGLVTGGATCQEWLDGAAPGGAFGVAGLTTVGWTNAAIEPCASLLHLYCVQQ